MICGDCKKYMECPNAGTVFTECVYEEQYWKFFRAEAAKDILCAMINRESSFTRNGNPVTKHDDFIEMAIIDADVLISKLKEKEESK